MNQEQQNCDKKRKAESPPMEKENSASLHLLTENEEKQLNEQIEDEDRLRTPSGTNISTSVSDIHSLFSPRNQSQNQKRQITKNTIPLKTTQIKINQAFKQDVNSAPLNSQLRERHVSHASVNLEQNTQETSEKQSFDHEDSKWSDDDSSSGEQNNQRKKMPSLKDEKEPSKEFLHYLSKMMQRTMEGEDEEKSAKQYKRRRTEGVVNKGKKSESKKVVQKVKKMESNTDKNPEAIGVAAVYEMLQQIESSIEGFKSEASKQIQTDLSNFKDKCVHDASEELSKIVLEVNKKIR